MTPLLRSPVLRRALAAASQLALVLPFVVVTDCTTHATTDYVGLQLFTTGAAFFLAVAMAVAVLFLTFPVLADPAVSDGLLGFAAGLALLCTATAPAWISFGDPFEPRVGYWIALGSWAGAWTVCVAAALRAVADVPGRADRALLALGAVPALVGIGVQLQDSPADTELSVGMAVVLLAPLASVAIAITRRARIRRGAAIATTVAWGLVVIANAIAGTAALDTSPLLGGVGYAAAVAALARVLFFPRPPADAAGDPARPPAPEPR
jgi:hypothetical protein